MDGQNELSGPFKFNGMDAVLGDVASCRRQTTTSGERASQVGILGKAEFLAAPDGSVAFRRTLSRPKALRFLKQQPKRIVEASSHCRGREKFGHEVRLSPVKPFVKGQKNDAGGGERRGCVSSDNAIRHREHRGTAVAWVARSIFVRQVLGQRFAS